jgi:type I restriction enzyme S subunit
MKYSCVPLGGLVTISGGGTPSRNNEAYWGGSIPWATVKDLKDTTLSGTQESITPEGLRDSASNLIPAGSVIVATRMGLGKVTINTMDVTINQDLKAFSCGADLEPRYLLYFLLANASHLDSMGKGATVKGITLDVLKDLSVPLPPLPEQKRIAAILDKADSIRRKRQEAVRLTEELLRSVFLDMFGDPVTNSKGWETGVLGDVIFSAKDGPHVSPEYSEDGIPFLSARHVKPGRIEWSDLKHITIEEAQIQWKKCKPEKGDILYTKGGTTGVAAVFDSDEEIAVWVHIALLKLKQDKVNPYWLENMLNSKFCYDQSQRYTHGITNQDLGLKRMVNIEMYIPPMSEQNKFHETVKKIKNLVSLNANYCQESESAFNSLLQSAFTGDM